MKLLDLFSGIGGFSLGLEASGHFETAAFCEVLPKPRHLLAHHWSGVPIYDDIRTLTAARLQAEGVQVEALCGGFPCQDISFAGGGAGLAGERSGLFWEIVRLVRELIDAGRRPRFIILENVAALLVRGLGEVLGALASLGYDLWWDCLSALAVGAPHRRDRLWIVAYARGEQHEGFGDALRREIAAQFPHTNISNAHCYGFGPDDGFVSNPGATGASEDEGCRQPLPDPRKWLSEPDVGRVAHGVPARVDRLHGLGNAVVPEIPRRLGVAIGRALERAA